VLLDEVQHAVGGQAGAQPATDLAGKQFDPECIAGFETIRERIIQETHDRLANKPDPMR